MKLLITFSLFFITSYSYSTSIENVYWSNERDCDQDTYSSRRSLHYEIDDSGGLPLLSGHLTFYARKLGSSNWEFLQEILVQGGTSSACGVGEYWPGLTQGEYEFSINLSNIFHSSLDYVDKDDFDALDFQLFEPPVLDNCYDYALCNPQFTLFGADSVEMDFWVKNNCVDGDPGIYIYPRLCTSKTNVSSGISIYYPLISDNISMGDSIHYNLKMPICPENGMSPDWGSEFYLAILLLMNGNQYGYESNVSNNSFIDTLQPVIGCLPPIIIDTVINTTGINTNQELKEIQIYPNPTVHSFKVANANSSYQLIVKDINGKELLFGKFEPNYVHFIEHLESGIYFAEILSNHSRVFLKFTKF